MNLHYSLQSTKKIITVASWEERFLLGTMRLIESINPQQVLLFYYKEYSKWSQANRNEISLYCDKKNIKLNGNNELSFTSPMESWKKLMTEIKKIIIPGEAITIDISTMPRETIWSICHLLMEKQIIIQYIYNTPQKNTKGYADWLSRDPGKPRILYKLAGIQHLGRHTALVIQTGYDLERAKQLLRFFEPERVLFGIQTGTQFNNPEQNRLKHEKEFSKRRNFELFDVDGYSFKNTYKVFNEKITPLLNEYNIIVSSLGPKVGALALYKIKQKIPCIALCYAPSNEFNRDYSKGIGDCIYGILTS